MPLYEYECPICGATDESEFPHAEIECTVCGANLDRVYGLANHLWDGGYPSKQAQPEKH